MTTQSEAALENQFIHTLISNGYEYVKIHDHQALENNFRKQINIFNSLVEDDVLTDNEFEKVMNYLKGGSIFTKAEKLRDILPLDRDNGERIWMRFLNKDSWCKNIYQVTNQVTNVGKHITRYDVTILVNGLPLVQVELKRRGIEMKEAFNQIKRYQKTSYKELFGYIQLFVISNGVNTRYFANSVNPSYKFTFNWTDKKNQPYNDLMQFTHEFLSPCTIGKILAKYIVLHQSNKQLMVLRPYQYYAVEEILFSVKNNKSNGYIWHTTGAGKTLTSFKAAQMASDDPSVDKVLFVVDRHDLDTQTRKEYDAFEPGAVDNTDNTRELIQRLRGDSKIIITTIQKLNNVAKNERYSHQLLKMHDQRIVLIFDECHRSQFGEMHTNITRFFTNTQCFGFTGTPIFDENASAYKTTATIFGKRLHEYLIKDAIKDENVLGFLVEYWGEFKRTNDVDKQVSHIDTQEAYMQEKRMEEIADYILKDLPKTSFDGEFNSLFAVQSVPMLIKYYELFKKKDPNVRIATIFTYAANDSQDDEYTGKNQGYANNSTHKDKLMGMIDDYNTMYDTSFSIDYFNNYYDDINARMKRPNGKKPIDLLLVVGMFLTGFDAKCLNTLYVDKNMVYHSLLQAFSRTNRILNDKKKFGRVVCFRNMKEDVDTAIQLFSNKEANEHIVMPAYQELEELFNSLASDFIATYPTLESIDELETDEGKAEFVKQFRELLRTRVKMAIYEDYDADELAINDQEFADYQSKYLDMDLGRRNPTEAESILADIDFELNLIHKDVVNVTYIIELIAELANHEDEDSYKKKHQSIIDIMNNDPELRSKTALIDEFIRNHFEGKKNLDIDISDALDQYIMQERDREISEISMAEDVPQSYLQDYVEHYAYVGLKEKSYIKDAVKTKKTKFREQRSAVQRIVHQMNNVIEKYIWK